MLKPLTVRTVCAHARVPHARGVCSLCVCVFTPL